MSGEAPSLPRAVVPTALFGVLSVLAYVGTWAVGGLVWDGYDPFRQAISELFALGAPPGVRVPLAAGLVVSGLGLVAFGWALDVGLPGRGRIGPVLAALSGVMTVAVVAAPCSAGCPGFGASATDTWHVVTAATGYVALMAAPLAIGWRVRTAMPRFAAVSWVFGGVALVLFLTRSAGLTPWVPGLQQRIFNTVADAWYVIAGLVLIRRARDPDWTGA